MLPLFCASIHGLGLALVTDMALGFNCVYLLQI